MSTAPRTLTDDERCALEAAKATGYLVSHSTARRMRATWRAYCERVGILHAEALQRAESFELKLDFRCMRQRLTLEARHQIDSLIGRLSRSGGAGAHGGYAPDVPVFLLQPFTRAILGIIQIDLACNRKRARR